MKYAITLLLSAGLLFGQGLGSRRDVIDRTQNDLRAAVDYERQHGKQVDRYENAQRHLSDFDREMTKGHFDKGKLDTAIEDVKSVVERNTLDPRSRDALRADLDGLRQIREHRDERY
jgi:hypothetical protein